MKVLFDHPNPFFLAHGGFQIQIEQTKNALEEIGVEVEWLRWWDAGQRGEIIHYFGRASPSYIRFAHGKGVKVVMAELLTAVGSRPATQRRLQRLITSASKRLLPKSFIERMAWDSYRMADAFIALTEWEAYLMREMFGVAAARTYVVPNGVEREFLDAPAVPRKEWLVCTATITERKRVLETAELAVAAKTPLWIIGKAYEENEYARRLQSLVANHPQLLRCEGAVSDRRVLAKILRESRGFILLSTMESLSLSALEAAACGCPLLLSDLPWARTVFGQKAVYFPLDTKLDRGATILREFYEKAPTLPTPDKPKSWSQIAQSIAAIYTSLSAP